MFLTYIANLRRRHAIKASMEFLLRRDDDRLLRDIGLTRHDLQRLIDMPPDKPKATTKVTLDLADCHILA